MNALIPNEIGIWIECCSPVCKKWRYSIDFDDPLAVPKKWYCYMNSDQSVNTCATPECLELEQGEIFIQSKFKAGSIVWAKIIGHPWSPAMVDFCPEFECYYWFDSDNTNVPSQYHVTFLSEKQAARAWVKSAFVKPFMGNEDLSYALKSRVCNKKLTARQRVGITKGYEIAQAALRLTILQRLKKYNFISWRLALRFRNQFANSGKKPVPREAGQSSNDVSESGAGPSDTKKATTVGTIPTKKSAVNNQFANALREDLKKPALLSTKRLVQATVKKLAQGNAAQKTSLSPQQLAFVVSTNHDDPQSDSATSVETSSTNIKGMDNTQNLEDTRSINSFDSSELLEGPVIKGRVRAVKQQVVEHRPDSGPAVNIFTDKRLSDEEITEIVNETLDKIIPVSQPSTQDGNYTFNKIVRKYEDADGISKKKQPTEDSDVEIVNEVLDEIIPSSQSPTPNSKYQFNKILRECKEVDNISKEKQPMEDSVVEIVTRACDTVILSPRISGNSKLSLKLKSMMEERRKRFDIVDYKSTSENVIRTENTENNPKESRYRRALSEFASKGQNPLLSDATNYQPRTTVVRKPLPSWFTDEEKKRKAEANRLSRLSKLSDEEDNRMYKENRENFITEMASADIGPSRERNKPDFKPPNYFMETQSYAHLLTSDEDSN